MRPETTTNIWRVVFALSCTAAFSATTAQAWQASPAISVEFLESSLAVIHIQGTADTGASAEIADFKLTSDGLERFRKTLRHSVWSADDSDQTSLPASVEIEDVSKLTSGTKLLITNRQHDGNPWQFHLEFRTADVDVKLLYEVTTTLFGDRTTVVPKLTLVNSTKLPWDFVSGYRIPSGFFAAGEEAIELDGLTGANGTVILAGTPQPCHLNQSAVVDLSGVPDEDENTPVPATLLGTVTQWPEIFVPESVHADVKFLVHYRKKVFSDTTVAAESYTDLTTGKAHVSLGMLEEPDSNPPRFFVSGQFAIVPYHLPKLHAGKVLSSRRRLTTINIENDVQNLSPIQYVTLEGWEVVESQSAPVKGVLSFKRKFTPINVTEEQKNPELNLVLSNGTNLRSDVEDRIDELQDLKQLDWTMFTEALTLTDRLHRLLFGRNGNSGLAKYRDDAETQKKNIAGSVDVDDVLTTDQAKALEAALDFLDARIAVLNQLERDAVAEYNQLLLLLPTFQSRSEALQKEISKTLPPLPVIP